ncbi:MAG: O-antigen ligase family protein [Acidobacteriota bacterium]|nr:O-antigen ligase family protein [Acidobacteriota bacterium]
MSAAISGISAVAICRIGVSWRRGFEIQLPPQSIAVVLVAAWGFLQIALKTTVAPQLTMESALVWGMSGVAFLLGSQILRAQEARKFFLLLLLWSLTALAVIAMLQFYSTPVRVFGLFEAPESVVGTFIYRNQFAALMELAAPIALWYMVESNALAGGLAYAMILAAVITAASRAGFVLVCAELGVFLAMVGFSRRREARAILAVFAGVATLVTLAAIIAGTDRLQQRFEDKDPYVMRRELVQAVKVLTQERPWAGHGMGTWRTIYPHVAEFDAAMIANEAHNDLGQWAAEGGVPFLLTMLLLVAWIGLPAIRSIWGLGFLSVMAHSYVDFPLREPALCFLWFALAGAVTQEKRQSRERRSREKN